MKCKFCELEFKNKHGLHIHWFYCLAKGFEESPIKYVGNEKYRKLMEDERLISLFHYPGACIKFVKDGEIGIKFGTRYILKNE